MLNNALLRLIKNKAAPRFELGIKFAILCLTTSPCCRSGTPFPSGDRISHNDAGLLVVCNGHGEDLIALRVLEQLHAQCPALKLEVLPLVGQGRVFDDAIQNGWLQRIGPAAALPSGGFSNQSITGLLADLKAGLPVLSWQQWRLIGERASAGLKLLAIGDLLPADGLEQWRPLCFIGTPSDYTWCSGPGQSPAIATTD